MRTRTLAVAVMLATASLAAKAESYSFNFGTWLGSGPIYQPGQTFATMSVATTDHLTYTFRVDASSNLTTQFGSGAFIDYVLFNTWTGADPIAGSTVLSSGSWGVGSVKMLANAPQVGGIGFDFKDVLGTNANKPASRLEAGEAVQWTATFATVQHDPFFNTPAAALHVAGFTQGSVTSGWYTPTVTPVPEPETYAMMLAGLGLMGMVSRRRRAIRG